MPKGAPDRPLGLKSAPKGAPRAPKGAPDRPLGLKSRAFEGPGAAKGTEWIFDEILMIFCPNLDQILITFGGHFEVKK